MSWRRGGFPRRFGVLLAWIIPLTSATAEAQPERVRVVVRTIAPIDEAFYERTAGQVSDLPAELRRISDPVLEPTMTARLDRARDLAIREDATMVVWFEHPSGAGPVVLVALPGRRRVLVRRIADESDAMSGSTSAMLEASSLVVRTALLAFEAGAALGVPNEELTRDEHPPPPRAALSKRRVPPPPPPKPRWLPFGSAGWQLTIDGRSPAGARAGVLEGGVQRGPWIGALRGSFGLPRRSHDDLVSLEVSRHSAGALLGRTLVRRERWQIDMLAGAALIVFRREAFPRDASFSPTPAATRSSFAGSLEARAIWSPTASSPIALGLSLGVDALTSPPSFSYEVSGRLVERPSWYVEPRAGFFAMFRAR